MQLAVAMSGRKRFPALFASQSPLQPAAVGPQDPSGPPDPQPSTPGPAARWFLVLASLALAAWIAFLATLAWIAS